MPTVLTDGTTLTGALLTAALAQSTTDALAGTVQSVAGRNGAVTLSHGDITDWTSAITAFVQAAVSASVAGVVSFNTRTGAITLTAADVVNVVAASSAPLIDGVAAAGSAATLARADHVHPVDTSRYAASNPSGFIPASGAPVQSVAGRTGAVALSAADIAGTTSNDNAASGKVGEYLIASVAAGGAVALTSNTPTTIAALSLSAGDWDVSGLVQTAVTGATQIGLIYAAASLSPASIPPVTSLVYPAVVAGAPIGLPTPTIRVSLSAPTTVYLVAFVNFSASTCAAFGYLAARRAR